MNGYIKRVIENFKNNYKNIFSIIFIFGIISYYLGWNFLDIIKIFVIIIFSTTLPNSFLLNKNKNLFLSIVYGTVSLWLFYIIFSDKVSTENYSNYFIYALYLYFVYITVKSIISYRK
ncbi:MAG: hypothetical protein U9N59_15445 [Campylobacterota bacterium]|nr:hypothetical protein [Campylobacterota bacterium]